MLASLQGSGMLAKVSPQRRENPGIEGAGIVSLLDTL